MLTVQDYIQTIEKSAVYDVALWTPVDRLSDLSESLGRSVYLKREDLQPVRSFKIRGAYQKMVSLSDDERARGVVAASAGNHAQGVALSAQKMNIDAVIVMPKTTPDIKVKAVRRYGVTVVLHGNTYDEACEKATQISFLENREFIHPYDDPAVISGQGTIGKELFEDIESIDTVFLAVGGGGLVSGVALYLKTKNPLIRVVAVESEDSACLTAAMEVGERVVLDQVGIFADGVAVRQIGEEPFRLCQMFVDDVITVTTDEICAAIKDIYDDCRCIAEPAGAMGIAGLKKYTSAFPDLVGDSLVTLNCGANINFDRLRHVSERAEIGEGKEALFAVTIPEKPGSFLHFCQLLGDRHVTEFNYRYRHSDKAYVFVGVELTDLSEKLDILDALNNASFDTIDLTENELAVLHIRHMVGGTSKFVSRERLYRFQFPECPGALLHFLQSMGEQWNISLFHYRNHGAAYGRVLVGLEVPDSDQDNFNRFLSRLGYTYFDESNNPAYSLFL